MQAPLALAGEACTPVVFAMVASRNLGEALEDVYQDDFTVSTLRPHRYTQVFIYTALDLALGGKHADWQACHVFTGAAPGGSSTSAIHGSRKTWKV